MHQEITKTGENVFQQLCSLDKLLIFTTDYVYKKQRNKVINIFLPPKQV